MRRLPDAIHHAEGGGKSRGRFAPRIRNSYNLCVFLKLRFSKRVLVSLQKTNLDFLSNSAVTKDDELQQIPEV